MVRSVDTDFNMKEVEEKKIDEHFVLQEVETLLHPPPPGSLQQGKEAIAGLKLQPENSVENETVVSVDDSTITLQKAAPPCPPETLQQGKEALANLKLPEEETSVENETIASIDESTIVQPSTLQRGVNRHVYQSPGAFAVNGLLNNRQGDNDGFSILTSPTATTTIPSGGVDTNVGTGVNNEVLTGEVVDEEAVRERVQARVVERMRNEAVEATGVRTVEKKGANSDAKQERDSKMRICLFVFGMIMMAIFLPVFLTSSILDASGTGHSMTSDGTPAPISDMEYLRSMLAEASVVKDETLWDDPRTAQYKAMEWLALYDPLHLQFQVMKEDERHHIIQRYVMAVIYYSTDGENWAVDLDFLTNTSICEWPRKDELYTNDGIQCNENGHVVSLRLDKMNLNGTLPVEVSSLTGLEVLSTALNSLHGTIPTEYGGLAQLNLFQLSQNPGITGTIPETLSNLGRLKDLFIAQCGLTGTIPPGITQIETLEELRLDNNYLTGTLPEFNPNNEKMNNIAIHGTNVLHGTLPKSLYELKSLRLLALGSGNYSGTIATEVGQLTNIESIIFYGNSLSGTFPTEFGNLINLKYLDMASNQLSGQLPSEIGNMERLESLYIEQNQFTGTLPSQMGNMDKLQWFWMVGNSITGKIPTTFLDMPLLGDLNLRNTSLDYDAFDIYCNQPKTTVKLRGDCLGDDPEVNCPCCAGCFDDRTGEYVQNIPQVCELKAHKYEIFDGGSRGATCSCPTEDGYNMTCTESCESCTKDGSVCVKSTGYGFLLDDNGLNTATFNTFQYTNGIDDTVIEFQTNTELSFRCSVLVNGEECRSCSSVTCRDNYESYSIVCDNVLGSGPDAVYDSCHGGDYNPFGPLSIFTLQDPFLRHGCGPWLQNTDENWQQWYG